MTTPALKRSMGIVRATAMVVGTIIGASIFVQPSLITGQIPSVGGVFAVWGAAGLLTLCGALVCAELASAYPFSGGVYRYLNAEFGRPLGFLWGWAMFWSMHSGIVAAIAVVFARYAGYFVPLGGAGVRVVAIVVILALSWINYVGVRQGSALQTAFTIGKLVAVVGMVAAGLALGSRLPAHFVVTSGGAPTVGVSGAGGARAFTTALVAGLFAFGGWHMVTYTGDETLEPERTIPRALLIGTLIVTACYMALNAVYLYILPLQTVISSSRVAADAADAVLGHGGALMSGLVMFSTFGALSGIILTGPRVYYAMSNDGLLFGWLGRVHPRFQTPGRAIVVQAVWSSALVATGTYRALFTRVVYTEWIFFGLLAAGLFLLRRRPDYAPRYRVWGFPVVPALFILSTAVIVANQLIAEPGESAFGLALVLAGLPVYYIWLRSPGEPGGVHASR